MYPHDNIFSIYYNIGKRTPFLVKRCELGLARSSSEERRIDPNQDRTFLVETVKPRGKYGKAYGKCFVNGKPDDTYRQECYPNIKDEEIPCAGCGEWVLIDVPGVLLDEIFPIHKADEILMFGKYKGKTFGDIYKIDYQYLHWLEKTDRLFKVNFEELKQLYPDVEKQEDISIADQVIDFGKYKGQKFRDIKDDISYLEWLKDHMSPDCIVTDVGSVKGEIHQAVEKLGLDDHFIGGHPMAGSEKTGFENATDMLIENAYYILTPTAQTDPAALEDFKELVASLGAIPMVLDYEQHDYATAAISHLPHIIAYSLVNLVKSCDDRQETMKTIAAGGFKDITRIASSSPVMWENICLSNQEQILRLIDSFCEELGQMRSAIAASDSKVLMEAFTSAKDYRDSLTLHANGTLKQVYELYMDLLDEAGGIATVATILASNHLSIKNIGIIHNREFEDGVLHLEMYDSESLAAAITLLKKHHYTIYER